MSRITLIRLVKAMLIVLVLAFLWVLFAASILKNKPLEPVKEGQTKLIQLNGQRVWHTVLSKPQRQHFQTLTDYVHSEHHPCQPKLGKCSILAETQTLGVTIIFQTKKPDSVPPGVPWFGGYINPISGQVYDLFGRRYQFNNTPSNATSLELIAID